MFTVAILNGPTPAFEYYPSAPKARGVTLFGGFRGNVERFHADPKSFCIFTVAKSGARYLVLLDDITFEAADTTGEFAPIPEEDR